MGIGGDAAWFSRKPKESESTARTQSCTAAFYDMSITDTGIADRLNHTSTDITILPDYR